MTIELVSTDKIAQVCSYCKKIKGWIPAGRQIPIEAASHGVCEECRPLVEREWGLS